MNQAIETLRPEWALAGCARAKVSRLTTKIVNALLELNSRHPQFVA